MTSQAIGFPRLGLGELLAILRGVSTFIDLRLLASVLLEFDASREGFRRWLAAVGTLAQAVAERTRTPLDDELACLLSDVVASDEQYGHLYRVCEPLLERLAEGKLLDAEAVDAAVSRARAEGLDPRLTDGVLNLANLAR